MCLTMYLCDDRSTLGFFFLFLSWHRGVLESGAIFRQVRLAQAFNRTSSATCINLCMKQELGLPFLTLSADKQTAHVELL